jgi:type I restriction enzyme M protein
MTTSNDYTSLVSKVWNYAHVLRAQGIGYGDYVGQITNLLFLKMDQERSELLGESSIIPEKWRWAKLASLSGDDLDSHYREALEALGKKKGLIGTIFKGAQNKLKTPANLKRVVSLIDGETWLGMGVDVKGMIYEGLLEKNAAEVKSGAGQYFTPRPLIQAMVSVTDPRVGETVHDPACGTGGFLLIAYDYMKLQPGAQDRAAQRKLREVSLSGVDIVDEVVRLCAMNMYLHGIGNGECPIRSADALSVDPGERYNVILTNPPFGKKPGFKDVDFDGELINEPETYEREDFKFTTSNKQINFLQHIMTIMESDGRAAVVLPDNVLFEAGSAGEGIRERLLKQFDFHTLLRLPTGIFYKPGVKANVLFFDKHPPRADGKPNSRALWIYDFRTNMHLTLKKNPLKREDLDDFVRCYAANNRSKRTEAERFKRFEVADLLKRDKLNFDVFWLKDESLDDVDSLPPPDEIAVEIAENLQTALEAFQSVVDELSKPTVAVIDLQAARRDRQKEREAIGCYVIRRLADKPYFGRTTAMKVLYLAETHVGLDLGGTYEREAAGPFDQWIYRFEETGVRNGWFKVLDDGPSSHKKVDYRPGQVMDQRSSLVQSVPSHTQQDELDRLISLLEDKRTEEVEMITTLFAAWNDFLIDAHQPNDDDIVREVRENWHQKKERFTPAQLRQSLDWLRRNSVTPTGRLPRTIHQKQLPQ